MASKKRKILWRKKRVKVPTILQMENTECGAASLSMILAHYHRYEPLEKLRAECGVSRDGMNALNLVKAARTYGLDARGFRMEPEALNTLELPLILHWNFNHFLVMEGRKGKNIYLNDPANGPRTVTTDEFNRSFTGLALQFIPTENFERGGKPDSLIKGLLSRMENAKMAIFFICLCSILLAVPGIIIPTMSRIFVDKVLGSNPDWLVPLLLAMGVTVLVNLYLTWLQRRGILELSINFLVSSSSKLFYHLLRLPTNFYYQRNPGDIQYRFHLNHQLADVLSGQAGETVANIFMTTFFLIVMFQYDVPLASAALLIAIFNILVVRFVNKRRQLLNQIRVQAKSKLNGVTMGGIQLMEIIKAAVVDFDFFRKWSGHQAQAVNAEAKMGASTITTSAIPQLLSSLNNTAILLFGAWRVIDGDITMGMLVAFQAIVASFLRPVTQLTNIGVQIQEARGCVDKLNDIIRYKEDPCFTRQDTPEKVSDQVTLEGSLELRNVSFGYSPLAEPFIENFSISVKPGKRVALVGRSGSGKSTVAKIAAGLYQPWEGEVLFDGKTREHYSRRCIEDSLAIVDQEIMMFGGSINDNLSMWNPLKDEDDIIHGAMDACIHQEIAERPKGYSSEIIEGGKNFSGGQRQRLEIARALSNNPKILILDEATSFLDPETEKIIDDNLRRRGCTCLIVAHRLSTIRDCEEIVVMANGKIVERGTHDELIQKTGGAYLKLIQTE